MSLSNLSHCRLTFDVSLLGLSLDKFQEIVRKHGWEPITSENWHIQHLLKYLEYRTLQDAIKNVGDWKY